MTSAPAPSSRFQFCAYSLSKIGTYRIIRNIVCMWYTTQLQLKGDHSLPGRQGSFQSQSWRLLEYLGLVGQSLLLLSESRLGQCSLLKIIEIRIGSTSLYSPAFSPASVSLERGRSLNDFTVLELISPYWDFNCSMFSCVFTFLGTFFLNLIFFPFSPSFPPFILTFDILIKRHYVVHRFRPRYLHKAPDLKFLAL